MVGTGGGSTIESVGTTSGAGGANGGGGTAAMDASVIGSGGIVGTDDASITAMDGAFTATGGTADAGAESAMMGSGGSTSTTASQESFTATGSLVVSRSHHTATLLPNGKVLVAGGISGRDPVSSGQVPLASAELYDPGSGTFSATGSMATPRMGHTATLLPNGKVLIAGGGDGHNSVYDSMELYDPTTGTFTATGGMTVSRFLHTATLLLNGKVLLAGGYTTNGAAELYDPTTGTSTATGSMKVDRNSPTATLLPNGKVLVAGGNVSILMCASCQVWASAELYDPTTGLFAATSNMTMTRTNHAATLLGNGKVLLTGGEGGYVPNSNFPESAELFDPTTEKFTVAGIMMAARKYPTATLLPRSELVLVAGGDDCRDTSPTPQLDGTAWANPNHCIADDSPESSELYDPAAGKFTATGSMIGVTAVHTATLLPSGKVLIVGGVAGLYN